MIDLDARIKLELTLDQMAARQAIENARTFLSQGEQGMSLASFVEAQRALLEDWKHESIERAIVEGFLDRPGLTVVSP